MTTIKEFDSTAIMLRKGIISLKNIFLLHLIYWKKKGCEIRLIRNNALIYELFLEAFNSKKKLSPKLE
jgi:hypothetical protein